MLGWESGVQRVIHKLRAAGNRTPRGQGGGPTGFEARVKRIGGNATSERRLVDGDAGDLGHGAARGPSLARRASRRLIGSDWPGRSSTLYRGRYLIGLQARPGLKPCEVRKSLNSLGIWPQDCA